MSPANKPKKNCRALRLLETFVDREGLDTSKLARRLDVSWETMRRIEDGGRPGIDVVFKLYDLAKIPFDAWRLT